MREHIAKLLQMVGIGYLWKLDHEQLSLLNIAAVKIEEKRCVSLNHRAEIMVHHARLVQTELTAWKSDKRNV